MKETPSIFNSVHPSNFSNVHRSFNRLTTRGLQIFLELGTASASRVSRSSERCRSQLWVGGADLLSAWASEDQIEWSRLPQEVVSEGSSDERPWSQLRDTGPSFGHMGLKDPCRSAETVVAKDREAMRDGETVDRPKGAFSDTLPRFR